MNVSKPILLLQVRPEDLAADNEYQAFVTHSGLDTTQLKRIRLDHESIQGLDLTQYSGIILGGGPPNISDPIEKKSTNQQRYEKEVISLLDEVVERDFPFLGACYGVGTLGSHQDGVVSNKFHEPVGAITISLSEYGLQDKLLEGVDSVFSAFVGHKEACEVLPASATLLASSTSCPVQMFRVKSNVYATQFHPELDPEGLIFRIGIYKDYGYFPPDEAEELIARAHQAKITEPAKILKNFVKICA